MFRILLTGLVLILSLAGCASSPFFNSSKNDPYLDPASQRVWYPLPSRGEHITVINKTSSVEFPVTVIDAYYAASGRSCSLYSETGDMNPSGLACRNTDHWVVLPFIMNPDAQPNNGQLTKNICPPSTPHLGKPLRSWAAYFSL